MCDNNKLSVIVVIINMLLYEKHTVSYITELCLRIQQASSYLASIIQLAIKCEKL